MRMPGTGQAGCACARQLRWLALRTRGYFLTQITRVTDALISSTPACAGAGMYSPRGNCGCVSTGHQPHRRRAGRAPATTACITTSPEPALRIERRGAGEAQRRHGFRRSRAAAAPSLRASTADTAAPPLCACGSAMPTSVAVRAARAGAADHAPAGVRPRAP